MVVWSLEQRSLMILGVVSASLERKRVVEAVYSTIVTIVDTLVNGMCSAGYVPQFCFITVWELLYCVLTDSHVFNFQRSTITSSDSSRPKDFFHSLTLALQ